jgi:hypothetical protein
MARRYRIEFRKAGSTVWIPQSALEGQRSVPSSTGNFDLVQGPESLSDWLKAASCLNAIYRLGEWEHRVVFTEDP